MRSIAFQKMRVDGDGNLVVANNMRIINKMDNYYTSSMPKFMLDEQNASFNNDPTVCGGDPAAFIKI